MRGASIYIGEDRILTQPTDNSPYGGFAGSPLRTLAHGATVEEVLKAVEETLTDCKTHAGMPGKAKDLIQPLIAASGEKTWRAISVSFAYVGVSEEGSKTTFFSGFPEKGAFLFRPEAHWHCDRSNRAEAIEAFRAAGKVAVEAQNLANLPQCLR